MLLKVLSVASPFAAVGPDAGGDAEQVVSRIDHALTASGHTSLVVACEGSETAGELFAFPLPAREALSPPDPLRWAAAVQPAIDRALAAHRVDLVHLHGLYLDAQLFPAHLPLLISLHRPAACYPAQVWSRYAGRAQFCCLSASQRRSLPAPLRDCAVIEGGVPLQAVESRWEKGDFAVALGPICPEKNSHAALEAGSLAGMRVLLGGEVFPFPEHQQYFQEQLEPRLRGIPRGRPQHAFLGRLREQHRHALLSRARCLLEPAQAAATTSLIAMEALAAGTPVVAYRTGALAEIVENGVTGFLVDGVEQMAEAIRRAHQLSPRACRTAAEQRFSADRMVHRYLEAYEAAARQHPMEALCA